MLRLETPDPADHFAFSEAEALAARAAKSDGQPPFNDQAMLDARSGAIRLHTAFAGETLVAVAAVSDDSLELVVDPASRRRGYGTELLERVLTEATPAYAWAHGDHPASRRLAATHGFTAIRNLLQLRMPLDARRSNNLADRGGSKPPRVTGFDPHGKAALLNQQDGEATAHIAAFRPGDDDAEWVELNARVFAGHPEQGRLTVDDLHARMDEPWFEADDFLVARSAEAVMIGYNWLKIDPEDPAVGEIYVIGVDSAEAGRGLGRRLMYAGLERLRDRGCTVAALYVDEENPSAVALYRSLGFTDFTVDVQYRRTV
ncbi:GNAT family N-acetyltransferase [Subtercola frigoramans]|uniref:Mycothiol acetyltransferase n=1 Tax=Subtercola frigoramans TaxID=120298 RepID=A0ABS2L2Y2_9MICO|nr:GNAT family N-acetyltransferase [Subtercola frigoramans]MBM7471458.1 mycothiol synthase [Subtercola frigoramans]